MSARQFRITALYERNGRQYEHEGLFNPRHTIGDVWAWASADGDRLVSLRMARQARQEQAVGD